MLTKSSKPSALRCSFCGKTPAECRGVTYRCRACGRDWFFLGTHCADLTCQAPLTAEDRHHATAYVASSQPESRLPPANLKVAKRLAWNRIREQINRARDASFYLGQTEHGRNEAAVADELELLLKQLEIDDDEFRK